MYETFGATVDHTAKTVTFQVFFPDNTLDPRQYGRGGPQESPHFENGVDFEAFWPSCGAKGGP